MVRCRPAARQGRSGDDGNRMVTMLGGEQCSARSEKMEAVLMCSPATATTGHSGVCDWGAEQAQRCWDNSRSDGALGKQGDGAAQRTATAARRRRQMTMSATTDDSAPVG
ncbi:hypothetical protein E2562_035653 [Oryza meyeriana var. granulata]|uniref:Uncharacterized protein n=1 Tax=Oryza meyeriana var. granulata TaxID=110450 RepID=A0A6G1FFJ7_9ORYZ|nr:hypothetical protein E2562_035653 [Oryza meyeriana var. granulata]